LSAKSAKIESLQRAKNMVVNMGRGVFNFWVTEFIFRCICGLFLVLNCFCTVIYSVHLLSLTFQLLSSGANLKQFEYCIMHLIEGNSWHLGIEASLPPPKSAFM